MTEMMDRVALALRKLIKPGASDLPEWDDGARQMARIAIEAMREPTKAMLDVLPHFIHPESSYGPDDAWRDMIDQALSEEN